MVYNYVFTRNIDFVVYEHVVLYDSIVPCYDYFISPVFSKMFSNPFILEQQIKIQKNSERFEDIKGVIKSRDWATWTQLKPVVNSSTPGE